MMRNCNSVRLQRCNRAAFQYYQIIAYKENSICFKVAVSSF